MSWARKPVAMTRRPVSRSIGASPRGRGSPLAARRAPPVVALPPKRNQIVAADEAVAGPAMAARDPHELDRWNPAIALSHHGPQRPDDERIVGVRHDRAGPVDPAERVAPVADEPLVADA